MINCVIAGVGGQGTVLASKLIAQCGIAQGKNARTAETIGMAQRGGCVVSHVRISEAEIFSPLVPLGQADLLIGFEAGEVVRYLPYLKEGGTVIVNHNVITPVTATLADRDYRVETMLDYLHEKAAKVIVVNGDELCQSCNSPKVLNVVLLGAAIGSGALGISLKDMEDTIQSKIKKHFHQVNLQALSLGAASVAH